MAKQTGSGSFKKAEGRQERDKATVTKLTGFFEAVHCLVDSEEAVSLPDSRTRRPWCKGGERD